MSLRQTTPLMILFLVALWSIPGKAEPRWPRVSWTENPAQSVFITWNDGTATESSVEYGSDTSYGATASGASEVAGGDLDVVHSVRLDGLSPDTRYHYRVGSSAGWSEDHTFSTAPADLCAPFTFGIAADNRGNFTGTSLCWATVYEAIVNEGVDFIINTGDLVEEGKNADEWGDFLETSAPWMATVPIIPSIGNHDDDDAEGDGALYNKIFTLPRNSANQTEDFFSFDYGNVHFVNLSTSTFNHDAYQMQLQWLDADLAASDKMWKVVFFHVPIYSSGDHGTNEDGKNAAIIPLFDNHHVDLVITGHDHIYERYRPMRAGAEVTSYDEGTCYIVSGGGGAAVEPLYGIRIKEPGLEAGDAKHHYVRLSVTNNVMQIRAVRVSGTGCYQGGEGVIDEFSIIKTLAEDPCAGPTDMDGDGFSPPMDCDDGNAEIHPGAPEICGDGIDQDCDGQDQDCPCADGDHDGYGDIACGGEDCDDTDATSYPDAMELCGDGRDNDCDGETDEADCEQCRDMDGDGAMAEEAACPSGNDCDDNNSAIYPGAEETCNGIDDDCDGETDEITECENCVDADGDGHQAANTSCPGADDCDDDNAAVHPGAEELCNGQDDDCDLAIDEGLGEQSCGTGLCAQRVPVCAGGQSVICQALPRPEKKESSCEDGMDNDCDGYTDEQDSDCQPDSGCGCGSSMPTGTAHVYLLGLMTWWAGRRKKLSS